MYQPTVSAGRYNRLNTLCAPTVFDRKIFIDLPARPISDDLFDQFLDLSGIDADTGAHGRRNRNTLQIGPLA